MINFLSSLDDNHHNLAQENEQLKKRIEQLESQLHTNQTNPAQIQPILFCGPSGVGKSTIINGLLKKIPGAFGFAVSHTTRQPRPGEEDGVAYHFITREKIEEMIQNGEFVEHAQVHGNYYGTSFQAIESVKQQGKICILDVDIQGVQTIRSKMGKNAPYCIFVEPPSFEVLEQRLRGRGTETEDSLRIRLGNASREMEISQTPGLFDFRIVNDDAESASTRLERHIRQQFPQLAANEKEVVILHFNDVYNIGEQISKIIIYIKLWPH